MKRVNALRNLEVVAKRISSGPQTGTAIVETLRSQDDRRQIDRAR